MREIAVVFDPERKLFLYFGVALLAIGVGPFGTYEAMTLSQRAIFWTLDVLGGMAILVPIMHVFFHSRLVAFIPPNLRFLLGVALGALPTAGFITVLYGTIGKDLNITTPFPLLYVEVTVFSTVLLLAEFVLWPALFGSNGTPQPAYAPVQSARETGAPSQQQTVALLSRLPKEHANSQIISISMQDHYAEITTTKGSTLILMRLSDAVDLLEGCAGARIHRSHWVARDFVTGIEKNGRRMEVTLTNGARLPVGNTYLEVAQQQLGVTVGETP